MTETLEEITKRILKDVPLNKRDAFLDWAISGMPIRTDSQKQSLIERIKGHNNKGGDDGY